MESDSDCCSETDASECGVTEAEGAGSRNQTDRHLCEHGSFLSLTSFLGGFIERLSEKLKFFLFKLLGVFFVFFFLLLFFKCLSVNIFSLFSALWLLPLSNLTLQQMFVLGLAGRGPMRRLFPGLAAVYIVYSLLMF